MTDSLATNKRNFYLRKDAVAKWIGYFSLLDLLILPYYQRIILPISLPIILGAFFFLNIRIVNDKYVKLFSLLLFVSSLSVLFSFVLPKYSYYFVDNLKRLVQLLSSFAYFFYFRWLVSRVRLKIIPVIWLFVVWFVSLALFFYLNPITLGAFIRDVYGRVALSEENLEMHLRFAYIFADPNTAAYFFLIATSPFIMRAKTLKWKFISVILLSIVLLLAQSRGAILALVIVMLLSIFQPSAFLRSLFNIKKIVFFTIICLAFYLFYVYLESLAKDNLIIKFAFERIFLSEDTATGGSRFEIWYNFLINFIPLPFGRGYNLLVNGESSSPHSDALRILYSYGILSLATIAIFLFSKIKSIEPLIIPAMMAFFINTLFDEQKMLALFLSLLAICLFQSEQQSNIKPTK